MLADRNGRSRGEGHPMGMFDKWRKKATQLAKEHPEEVEKYSDEAIKRAGTAVDSATHDKYSDQIKAAEQKADDAIE
jgi:hypothetical protein